MTMRQAALAAFNREFREMVHDGEFHADQRRIAWMAFWRGWQAHIRGPRS